MPSSRVIFPTQGLNPGLALVGGFCSTSATCEVSMHWVDLYNKQMEDFLSICYILAIVTQLGTVLAVQWLTARFQYKGHRFNPWSRNSDTHTHTHTHTQL